MTPKDILTNRCFCPMPWTGLMYNFDGTVKNCIRSSNYIGDIKKSPIEEILLGDLNQSTQQQMINREPGMFCDPCYELEKNKTGFDIISDRIFYIRELKSIETTTYKLGNHDLHTVDVRWTNLCNFGCVYCGPMFSSRWADELNLTQARPTDEQRQQFRDYIFENVEKLKHVYLAGGEPLLMKENLELLTLLKQKNPEVNIRINTNLSKTNTNIFDLVCEFKNVHWTVSAETQGNEYEYIRHGGSWNDFLDNLMIIKNLNHKISFNMLHFLLNYNSLFDCIDYFKSLGFHNNSFIIGALLDPLYLNIRHLPDSVLNLVKKTLEQRINEHPGYLLEDSYRNLHKYLDQPFEKDLAGALAQLAKLDQRRQVDSRVVFKDLYKLKEE